MDILVLPVVVFLRLSCLVLEISRGKIPRRFGVIILKQVPVLAHDILCLTSKYTPRPHTSQWPKELRLVCNIDRPDVARALISTRLLPQQSRHLDQVSHHLNIRRTSLPTHIHYQTGTRPLRKSPQRCLRSSKVCPAHQAALQQEAAELIEIYNRMVY